MPRDPRLVWKQRPWWRRAWCRSFGHRWSMDTMAYITGTGWMLLTHYGPAPGGCPAKRLLFIHLCRCCGKFTYQHTGFSPAEQRRAVTAWLVRSGGDTHVAPAGRPTNRHCVAPPGGGRHA